LQHGNFHVAYHVVHNIQFTEGILKQTKPTSRLNVEDDLICASPCIELRMSMLSNRAATNWYFRGRRGGEQNDCKL